MNWHDIFEVVLGCWCVDVDDCCMHWRGMCSVDRERKTWTGCQASEIAPSDSTKIWMIWPQSTPCSLRARSVMPCQDVESLHDQQMVCGWGSHEAPLPPLHCSGKNFGVIDRGFEQQNISRKLWTAPGRFCDELNDDKIHVLWSFGMWSRLIILRALETIRSSHRGDTKKYRGTVFGDKTTSRELDQRRLTEIRLEKGLNSVKTFSHPKF